MFATVVALMLLAWYVNTQISLEQLVIREELIRNTIAQQPWRSFVVGFSIYTGLSLVPGLGGKAIVVGWLFGFWQAMIMIIVGLSSAAMVIFFLSRYLFRDYIERRYTSFLARMNRHLEREGAFYLLTLRMAHAPYSIVNPVSGASRLPPWTFFWTTAVGLLPGTTVSAYVGVSLPSLRELSERGPISLIDPSLIAALAASAVLPLLVRWLLRRFPIPARGRPYRSDASQKSRDPKPR